MPSITFPHLLPLLFPTLTRLCMDTHTAVKSFKVGVKHCSQKSKDTQNVPRRSRNISAKSQSDNTSQRWSCSWVHFHYSREKFPVPTVLSFRDRNHRGSKRCQNSDRKPWAFVEHPIICKTIKKNIFGAVPQSFCCFSHSQPHSMSDFVIIKPYN